MHQNEIIRTKPRKPPQISWRVYYDEDGKIVACSPTPIIGIPHPKHVPISAELGYLIISGKANVDDYRVVQVAGVMKVIEIRAEEKNTKVITDYKTTSGRLKYYQIENLGDSENFVIGVTPALDKGNVVFQANPANRDAALRDIEEGNIPDATTLFFTKKNDPSWLYFKMDISVQDVIRNGLIVESVDVQRYESFSVFTENFVEGVKIFDAKEDKHKDVLFYEFLNDFKGPRNPALVNNIHLSDPIFDLTFSGTMVSVSVGEDYRHLLEKYLEEVSAKTHLTLFVMDRTAPFFLRQQIDVELQGLLWNNQVHLMDVSNPLVYADVGNPNEYIRVDKRKDVHFKNFTRALELETVPVLLEAKEAKAPVVVFTMRRTTILASLNRDYADYLKRWKVNWPVTVTVAGKTIKNYNLDMQELIKDDVEFPLETTDAAIYIDVPNPSHYFQIKRR